ncbi:helix-turn-helix domain-containing protein [Mycobacterium koreense]|uniref:Uncharacterized protein n=1 Tax=Mycolicibacillus koreensis TaxID=1069220 RepID=A0A7I7SD66_9MYCO|nr:helix-turn-helix domain-containing protein [Mycolicibacillus koreensis]MCV7247821.1 helix-turn-helix domain-containing protein [Mycolicibacillus koreensis]OSC34665.1 hypothetical protein B8W67_05290 [Mycolicibacillus koreensis]BBY54209.1 hypothetical protein MKOR_14600 [Mycolicibacillus koreensis]
MTSPDTDALTAAVAALVAAVRPETKAAEPTTRRLLTVPEAADALRVGRTMVYAMLRDGRLSGVKIGRRRLVPAAEIDRLIASGGVAA